MTPSVLVVGSVNMDLVMRCPRLPAPGETLVGGDFAVVPGGKGANQAASAARLGCAVRLIAAVGADDFGEAAIANLERQRVDVTSVARRPASATGVAMIMVDAAGENSIIVASGANATLTAYSIAADAAAFAWADLVVVQCEVPLAAVSATVEAARAQRKPVILNAAPAPHGLPESVLAVDYLVVNEHEAETLTGLRADSPELAIAAAEALTAHGARCVIVTLGPGGCVFRAGQDTGHVPAPVVDVVDTTAAGDAFVGALAACIGRGAPLIDALRYANTAGALAVTKAGAQPSLPDAESVQALLCGTWGSLYPPGR